MTDASVRGRPARRFLRASAGLAVLALLAWFYHAAATAHARTVNTSKARGDQSAYLGEAKLIYANWTGKLNPPIVQPRNRMPLYPAFLAMLYDPAWSDDELFVHAKEQSIWLSLVLLAAIGFVARRSLPPLLAANLLLIVAFGCFVFRAGYAQSEVLFNAFNFVAFVMMWRVFRERSAMPGLVWAGAAGALAATAHLTKAAMLPLVALFVLVCIGGELLALWRRGPAAVLGWRLGGGVVTALVFLAVLYPYVSTSKRVHGQYFYNLNTSALIWYDNYPQASIALMSYGPDGWPPGPPDQRPGLIRYWREHTTAEIAARFGHGFLDMLTSSYRTFWYLKFVAAYLALAVLLAATARRAFLEAIGRNRSLVVFLGLYAAVYVPAIAFYEPVSGTGTTRFLMPHLTPFLFACSAFFAAEPFRRCRWPVGDVEVTAAHLHIAVLGSMLFDIAFWLWPRIMTTYGGF
jgi:hypothetical protein